MRLDEIAGRVDAAGAALAGAADTFAGIDPAARAFGADAGGRLGELGRSLHRRVSAALQARSREAGAHGERLAETAHTLRAVAAGYGETDREAGERHNVEEG